MLKGMRYLLLGSLFLAAAFGGACSTGKTVNTSSPANVASKQIPAATPAAAKEFPFPSVDRISLADAKADFDAGNAVFIDTHSEQSFAAEHITGSINVPSNKLNEKADTIPKGKKIITYCS